jgi:hypothetical protein
MFQKMKRETQTHREENWILIERAFRWTVTIFTFKPAPVPGTFQTAFRHVVHHNSAHINAIYT